MPLDITGESAYGRDWEGVAPLDLGRGETAEDQQMRYALSPSAPDAPDIELRTKATIITQHFTGRFDPHGRMWSGPDHGPMQPKAYYDKMMEYVRTGNPETLWSDEAKEYRKLQTDAERRDFAASHWRKKWDDYTDPLVDRAANATEAKAVENTLKDLQGISDTLDEQDAAFVASFMENRPSGEYHDDSEFSPTDSTMGMMPDADTMAKKRAAHLERVEYDRRLEELWSKNSKAIEKQKLVDKYEARLASENQWQSYLRIRNNLTDDEAQVLDMALSAGGKARTFLGSTLTPEVKEAFMALSVESQRKVAPFLKDNAWRRDTTWVGDAVRGLARITGETIEDAGIGAAEYVRRIVVDGKEYQDGVERRALLRLANEGRMKEWGIAGDVLIDAIGNIGYMGLAAIPYAGTAMMMLSAGEQFEREAALAGADVSGWDMIGAKLAFSAAYAAVEGMQSHQIFGELTDFERRQLYANLTHHFNGKLWAKLGANVAIDTMHESIEEGIQNGIQDSYVALGLDKPLPEAFCKGFVEDFMASLPSMLVTSGFGHGRRIAQYRNRPFSGPEEVLKQGIELEKVARATGERGSGAEGLAEMGRMMGFVSRDWRRAAAAAAEAGAGAAELRKAALMKYGLDEGQALQWDAMLTEIERNIGEDKAAVQAFYGTQNALTRSEIRQAGGMTETVDEATGARTLTFKDVFGTGTFSVELNAASGIDAEYARTDEGVRSIVNALNDSRQPAPDGGAWTDENWRALPEADKQSILSEFRNPGLTTFTLSTGETVDNRFLAALEGKMQIADNAESGDVLGVAAFHEQGHVAGRMLALAARNGDEKAKELVGKLAEKFGTAKLGSEDFDEEVFGDRFRDYLVGRFDVQDGRLVRKAGALDVAAEDETLFGQFVDWVRSLFSRADEAVRTRTRYDEFFEQAVNGDLEGAVAADDAAAGERESAEIPRSTQENTPETVRNLQEGDENGPLAPNAQSGGTEPSGIQKQAGTAYPDASAEIRGIDERASITAKRLDEFMRILAKNRPDLDAGKTVAELEKFDTPKEQKIALHWVVRGGLLLPEDAYKVADALSVAEKAKVDPFQYKSPDELLLAHKEFKPSRRPIDPATVPELSDPRDEGDGIVSYLVQDDKQGQAAMRRIIDTHWGEDANPWCLLATKNRTRRTGAFAAWLYTNHPGWEEGDSDYQKWEREFERTTGHHATRRLSDEESLVSAWQYWQHYSALPKRVAFKDGKLLAFMATEKIDLENWSDAQRFEERLNAEYPELRKQYDAWTETDEAQENGIPEFADWLDVNGFIGKYEEAARTSEEWWDRKDE